MDPWHFGVWTETVRFGLPELAAMTLAAAIVLPWAWLRYRGGGGDRTADKSLPS